MSAYPQTKKVILTYLVLVDELLSGLGGEKNQPYGAADRCSGVN